MLPATTLLPRGETLFHFPHINILEIFKDFSSITRKYSKTFHQQFGNIQRLFRLQNCLSLKSSITRKYSKTFRLATSSSNQQQQKPAEINSTNQLSFYQQHLHNPRRPPLVITTVPSRGYISLAVDLGLVARQQSVITALRPIFVTFPLF